MRTVNEELDKYSFEALLIKLGFRKTEETEYDNIYQYGKLRCRISKNYNLVLIASGSNILNCSTESIKTFRKFTHTFELTLKTDKDFILELEF